MKTSTRLLTMAILTTLCLPFAACKDEGEGTENPDGEAAEVDPMVEMKAIPADIQGEIDLVMKPLTDLESLMADLQTAPERLSISAKDLKGMIGASFKDGKVEVSANVNISEEAKAEVQAMLEKAKGIGQGLANIGSTTAKATENILGHSARAVALSAKLTPKLTAKAKFAKGEEKTQIDADLAAVQQITADVPALVDNAKSQVMEIPAKAAEMGAKFTASLAAG